MGITRRFFMKSSGLAIAGLGSMTAMPRFLLRASTWNDEMNMAPGLRPRHKTLIAIFQRGAADGLNMVIPFAEQSYYAMRPTIAIPTPKTAMRKRRSTSTDSSRCIRRSRPSSRCTTPDTWRSFMPPALPTIRARISTPRILWSPARPA